MNGASDILKKILVNAINHGFTLLAAWLISKGIVSKDILTPENLAILAGGAVAGLISLFMVVYRRIKERYMVEAAKRADITTPNTIIEAAAKAAIKAETPIPNLLVK